MYSALDRPVRYANCVVVCADYLAIWPDRPVLYSNYPALYPDGPNGSFKVCTVRGSSGAGLSNSFLKTGPTTAGLDDPRSRVDGPDMCRSTDLPPICVGGCGCPGYVSIGILYRGCDWS
jgi:hypothetical protein